MNPKSPVFAALAVALLACPSLAHAAEESPPPALEAEVKEQYVPFSLSFLPGIGTNGFAGSEVVNNLSVGILATRAGRVEGLAISSGVNITDRRSHAALVGAVANISGDLVGAQIAGGVNVASGTLTGLQTAGVLSIGERTRGAQISVINIGGDVTGAQIGVLNIARKVTGLQLGVVNLSSEMSGAPIGLLSVAGNGQFHVQAYSTDAMQANVALKYGGRHVYTLLSGGYAPGSGADAQRFRVGFGVGLHLPMDELFLDVDGTAGSVISNLYFRDGVNNLFVQGRAVIGYQLASRAAVFGGLTANLWFRQPGSQVSDMGGFRFVPSVERRVGDYAERFWPGLVFGVQI